MAGTTRTSFVCAKCRHTEFETDEFRATGGNFAKIFDVQNKKFSTVSCLRCGYTERRHVHARERLRLLHRLAES